MKRSNTIGAVEYRTYTANLGITTREDATDRQKITGHAAVFDVIDGPEWFKERVARGAFVKSIAEDDIRALFNHDANIVLGRNRSNTLSLREDETGLFVEIDPPDTQAARDLLVSISRGDITQMSFAFEIEQESREKGEGKEPDLYTLERVKLWDVSPVTYPFYRQTDVSVSARQAWSEAQRIAAPFQRKGWSVRLQDKQLTRRYRQWIS